MNKYNILCAFLIIFAIIIGLLIGGTDNDNDKNKIKKSKKGRFQGKSRSAKDSLRKQLANALDEKADVTKKYEIETLCIQAGYNISFGEYFIIRLTSTILIPIIFYILTNNIFLIILFAIIGYSIPSIFKTLSNKRKVKMEKQVGSFMRIVLERYKITKDMLS